MQLGRKSKGVLSIEKTKYRVERVNVLKRLISCTASEMKQMTRKTFKQAIVASEGRTIMGETIVTAAPLLEEVTNAEVMAAFGVDLLVLNEFDVFEKKIAGFYRCENPIDELKKLTGRPVGINLEPVDEAAVVLDKQVAIAKGRQVLPASVKAAEALGIDFITITGNPSTGVSNHSIKQSVKMVRENFSGLIFAGKMHGAGLREEVLNLGELKEYIRLGADGVLIPTVGTVPGISEAHASEVVREIKKLDGLVIHAMGTSQESADEDTIRAFGLSNKRVGGDIHHIGDGAYGRTPPPENILALSIAVRGKRHAYFRMSQSIHR